MGNLPHKQIGWSQESNLLWEVLKQLDLFEGTVGMLTDVVPSSRVLTINGVSQDLSADRTWTILGTAIGVVPNFSALPTAPSVPGEFYWVEESQGTQWLPGALGGTYYNAGLYYSNGIEWTYMETPYQATQAEVDAGVNFNKFLTPLTFENAAKWNTKQGTLTLTTLGSGGPATLVGDVLNIPVYTGGGGGGQTENFNWRFDTSTVAGDPGNGRFRANNASAPAVTELYIDSVCTDTGLNIDNIFGAIDGNWAIYVQQENDATKFAQYSTSGPYTNNGGWWTIPVTYLQSGTGGGLTNNAKCTFYFVNKNSGSGTAGTLLREEFVWNSGPQQFTLMTATVGQVYSVEVQGQGALSTSQYTLVPPNIIQINDTLNAGDYIVVIYSEGVAGVVDYYTQAQTDALLDAKQDELVSGTNIKTIGDVSLLGSGNVPMQTTITTSVSITTATLSDNGLTQYGKHVLIKNGSNNINITINGVDLMPTTYQKEGTGTITFVQGAGRTLRQVDGTAILNGALGSTAALSSDGTLDSLRVSNA